MGPEIAYSQGFLKNSLEVFLMFQNEKKKQSTEHTYSVPFVLMKAVPVSFRELGSPNRLRLAVRSAFLGGPAEQTGSNGVQSFLVVLN